MNKQNVVYPENGILFTYEVNALSATEGMTET
jgi:hypothetical protein